MYSRRTTPNDLEAELKDLLTKRMKVSENIVQTNNLQAVMAFLVQKYGDQQKAIQALLNEAAAEFGSGSFGHSWLAYFPNDGKKPTTYGYHANGPGKQAFEINNPSSDSPSRDHKARICQPVTQLQSQELTTIAKEETDKKQEYTWQENCTEFAGKAWNRVMTKGTGTSLEFRQKPVKGGLMDQLMQTMHAQYPAVATPGQLGYVIGAANGSEEKRQFKLPTEVLATAPLPGSADVLGVFTKDRYATIRMNGTTDIALAGSRPVTVLTAGTKFFTLDTVATFNCSPSKDQDYPYFVFSGSKYATVNARTDGDNVVLGHKGSPTNISNIPAFKDFDHVDAVMNVTSRVEQCSPQGRSKSADFVVFSGKKYKYITVDPSGDLTRAEENSSKSGTLRIDKVRATIGVPGSKPRYVFYGGKYEKIDAPEPSHIRGTGHPVTENWLSFSNAGLAP
ncbi:hypothetical protein ACFVFQ_38390 [Streptomyces sp. NPDC057743]|uniref:hypothetical protein n=1 Tax=Streptomyces sp. NPDC057743 TaxID=3346236 RepID=UPI0036916230